MSRVDEVMTELFSHLQAAIAAKVSGDDWRVRIDILNQLRLRKQGYETDELRRGHVDGNERMEYASTKIDGEQLATALWWLKEAGAIAWDADTERWYAVAVAPHAPGSPGTSATFKAALENMRMNTKVGDP